MTRRWPCILIICCLLATATAREAIAGIKGNDFQALSDTARMYYLLDTIDAWGKVGVESRAANAPVVDTIYGDISRCVTGRQMTQGQGLAIVDKYIRDNPAQWHRDMSLLIWYAFREACK